ncbi:hypothetical protein LGQ03_12065 [Loktanella sp. TSTF-M6]|uniref:Uncharacterized protein n=1 Tax=Loktanella gaetbuli TaxID=2881335 RepID=A0ABS8BW52_9RHOB|nr:hypothetical protein [Loktanella gaetbuli]MCB5199975.1 hypothetical protein [Loktanella gaetbuli]
MSAITAPLDHFKLEDTRVTRRYFAKFHRITRHLTRVAATLQAEGGLNRAEISAIVSYLAGLNYSFTALSHRYHMAGRVPHAGQLTIDRIESGFPVHAELMDMAADAARAAADLADMPSVADLKGAMVRQITGDLTIPTDLQFTLARRLYLEELAKGRLFLPRNDPQSVYVATASNGRRRFLVHWAVYDSEVNLPVIYLMDVEDSGRTALPKDDRRWPQAHAHLMAQSLTGLKLLTIATGFDQDFDDLHPVRLRRFHIGPMYSHAFTRQSGPLRDVLAVANSPEGDDWALVWTEEELMTDRVESVKSGWFGTVERQIFAQDPFADAALDRGASRMERSLILPARPYQALADARPAGFADVVKYVVSDDGRVVRRR